MSCWQRMTGWKRPPKSSQRLSSFAQPMPQHTTTGNETQKSGYFSLSPPHSMHPRRASGRGHTLIEGAILSNNCRQFSPHVRAQAYRIQNKTKEALEDLDMAIQHGNGQPTILKQVKHQCSLLSFNHTRTNQSLSSIDDSASHEFASSLQKKSIHTFCTYMLFLPPFLYLGLHSARRH